MNALITIMLLWLAPRFDRVDYAHPERYLGLPPGAGASADVTAVAAQIHGATDDEKLRAIAAWMKTHLHWNESQESGIHDFGRMLQDGTLRRCSDAALFFRVLARAIGVPTVWVKTMDVDWIREFAHDPKNVFGWRGHVFVACFVGGRWRLVDSTQLIVYDDYDPRTHVLPGNPWAYDKGGDPIALTLSPDKENWEAQTRSYFGKFDVRQLPLETGRPLVRSLVAAADKTFWDQLNERAQKFGVPMTRSGNSEIEKWIPAAKGNFLVLTVVGTRIVLPPALRDTYSPLSTLQIEKALSEHSSGRADRTLTDGTRVILLYARDAAGLTSEIEKLEFPKD